MREIGSIVAFSIPLALAALVASPSHALQATLSRTNQGKTCGYTGAPGQDVNDPATWPCSTETVSLQHQAVIDDYPGCSAMQPELYPELCAEEHDAWIESNMPQPWLPHAACTHEG